jgi:hypothetical protein
MYSHNKAKAHVWCWQYFRYTYYRLCNKHEWTSFNCESLTITRIIITVKRNRAQTDQYLIAWSQPRKHNATAIDDSDRYACFSQYCSPQICWKMSHSVKSWTGVFLQGYNLGDNHGSSEELSVESVARNRNCPTCLLKCHRTFFSSVFGATVKLAASGRHIHKVSRSHTPGSTLLNEWTARLRGLYLHNQHTRQTSIPSARLEIERPQVLLLRPVDHPDRPSDFYTTVQQKGDM